MTCQYGGLNQLNPKQLMIPTGGETWFSATNLMVSAPRLSFMQSVGLFQMPVINFGGEQLNISKMLESTKKPILESPCRSMSFSEKHQPEKATERQESFLQGPA